MTTLADLLKKGIELHKNGHIQAARDCYGSILVKLPNQPDALNLLGMLEASQDNGDVGLRLLRRAIDVKPNHVGALTNLGNALQKMGDVDSAIICFERALSVKPKMPQAQNNLGIAYQAQGDSDQAIACFEQAVAMDSNYGPAHHNLAKSFIQLKQWSRAAASCKKAFAVEPLLVAAKCDEGRCWMELEEYGNAEQCFRTVLQKDPEYALAHFGLGRAQYAMHQAERALVSLEKARSYNDELPGMDNELGIVLQSVGEIEAAEAAYWRGLSRTPSSVILHANLSTLFEKTNRLEDAEQAVKKGLVLDPNHPLLNLIDAKCKRRRGRLDESIEGLTTFVNKDLKDKNRQAIHFELGRLHDRMDNPELAFAQFALGNDIAAKHWRKLNPGANEYNQVLREISSQTSEAWVESFKVLDEKELSHPENQLVFLVGFPRSGTTLMDTILDAHPDIQVLEEFETLAPLRTYLAKQAGGFMQALANLDTGQAKILQDKYFDEVDRYIATRYEKLLVDKLPLNATMAGLIHRVFPDAKFIFAIRHPNDVVLSCFMQEFALTHAMANFLDLQTAADFYVEVIELWGQLTQLLPLPVHELRYEDLIDDFEPQVRELIEFLELPWNNAVLHFDAHARQRGKINTPSYHQVSQPIYKHAQYRWERYRDQMADVSAKLEPYVRGLGYE